MESRSCFFRGSDKNPQKNSVCFGGVSWYCTFSRLFFFIGVYREREVKNPNKFRDEDDDGAVQAIISGPYGKPLNSPFWNPGSKQVSSRSQTLNGA